MLGFLMYSKRDIWPSANLHIQQAADEALKVFNFCLCCLCSIFDKVHISTCREWCRVRIGICHAEAIKNRPEGADVHLIKNTAQATQAEIKHFQSLIGSLCCLCSIFDKVHISTCREW